MLRPFVLAVVLGVLTLFAVTGSRAASLADVIVKVEEQCGATISDLGKITITADEPISVTADCRGGRKEKFVNTDGVHYVLEVAYDPAVTNKCVFQKKTSTQVYALVLHLAWVTTDGSPIELATDKYTAVCTYDKKGTKLSDVDTIDTSKFPFSELETNMAKPMVSQIELLIVDVKRNPISGQIILGRKIGLRGYMTPATADETAMRVTSCLADNGVNIYHVLVAGCGDGVVFPQNLGFTTNGTVVDSPYFSAFRLQGNDTMRFLCNFTACSDVGGCDGDSCTSETRRKREVNSYPILQGSSPSVEINDTKRKAIQHSGLNDVEDKSFKFQGRFRRWLLRADNRDS